MEYSVDDLVNVLRVFVEKNIDFIIIGDTVIQLALKKNILHDDVDLFIVKPSIFEHEEVYRELALENNWIYTCTEIGTPRIIARSGDKEITIELYENFMDINIPEEILINHRTLTISGLKIKILNPEQYIVLKTIQGVDLDKVREYLRELKKIDLRLLRKTIESYQNDEQSLIRERLREIGLEI